MSDRFTLTAGASLQQEIRKSRFLAQAAPVECVDAALAFVAHASDRDATHNCWAYRIGSEYRFSDDGEPGGTAGKPILQAIDGQSLDRIAVVVTRWFGGIKLGAGGLVRAYGRCAAECLRTAPRVAIVARTRACIRCDFAAAAALYAHFAELSIAKLGERFDAAGVELAIELPKERLDALVKLVGDLTRGRGRVDAATDSSR
jgi:uncharacterized YigZ family protein